MTIAQRIELRRLGYTKEEVNEIAELEKAPVPEPVPEESTQENTQLAIDLGAASTTPDVQSQLLAAINNLTAVMQGQRFTQAAQPETKAETPEDIFNNILKG